MPKLSHALLAASLATTAAMAVAGDAAATDADAEDAMTSSGAAASAATTEKPAASDRYLWLEDVNGDKQLDWVRAQNAKAEAELASSAEFKQLEADIRGILDSDAKIPAVEKIGEYYYNFWKDKQHERGLWRRTTLAEFRKDKPQWETVIDLDALNKAEGKQWVWHGTDCLKPAYRRCLVALSPGGSDADVTREFDLVTKQWVQDGFFRPEAKGGLGWIDQDTVYVFTDFGPGTMTSSGYPQHRQAVEARHAAVGGDAGL